MQKVGILFCQFHAIVTYGLSSMTMTMFKKWIFNMDKNGSELILNGVRKTRFSFKINSSTFTKVVKFTVTRREVHFR